MNTSNASCPPAIELVGITKYFPGTVANDGIDLKVMPGEVHALLGENGAGKSTLMKILYGMYRPDRGQIFIDGKPADIRSPQDAVAWGIGMIHQHFTLVPVHTVLENVLLGRKDYNPGRTVQDLEELGRRYGLEIDPHALVGELPVGLQQRVEILKALSRKSRLLIMDEPTAVLTPAEVKHLFDFVREFRAAGNSIVFISHKMSEVLDVADRITVLRGGRVSGSLGRNEAREDELVRLMVGRNIVPPVLEGIPSSRIVLEVRGLSVDDDQGIRAVDDLAFSVRSGEIFGVAGVSGNGQVELAEALCGLRCAKGEVLLEGDDVLGRGPLGSRDAGMGFIPEDRHRFGLVLDMSLEENLMLKGSDAPPFCRRGRLDRRALRRHAAEIMQEYSIKAPHPTASVKSLSGGNQQKIVVAREVLVGNRFIVAFQPIRGLDIGAADYVHRVLLNCRSQGRAILLISTELSEILELSDRIGVMYRGRMPRILDRDQADVETIGRLMAGGAAA